MEFRGTASPARVVVMIIKINLLGSGDSSAISLAARNPIQGDSVEFSLQSIQVSREQAREGLMDVVVLHAAIKCVKRVGKPPGTEK